MRGWCLAALVLVTGFGTCFGRKRKLRTQDERWLRNVEILLAAINKSSADGSKYRDEEEATRWMAAANEMLRKWRGASALAGWNFTTNISDETQNMMLEVEKQFSDWFMKARNEGVRFHTESFSLDLQRQLALFTQNSESRDPAIRHKTQKLLADMQTIYNTATVCQQGLGHKQGCLPLEPDLQDLMHESRDPEKLKRAWQGWRDAAGRPMRDKYRQFVEAANQGAVENGYTDFGQAWRHQLFFDTQDLQHMVDKLWHELRPLYLELHAYVRRRLREHYGDDVIGTDGTIPAHVLGNMWAQNWKGIYPLVTPYPEEAGAADGMQEALQDKYDEMGLFHLADAFYTSLGLDPMTDFFWGRSIFLKPRDRDLQCHASATDMFSDHDFRIKMCTEVDESYLETVHHEMGHVQYFMAYARQPTIYRAGANCAFHEAIGDTISLSVLSRTHLHSLGLDAGTGVDKHKQTINDLMKEALFKVGFLPFGLLVDRWRWQVFSGQTPPEAYNRDWWKLRLDLQGIRPPMARSERDFDPGAKFHVPANSPYICYFVSYVIQFQFYQALCQASGHQGQLHLCDFHGSAEAGAKLKRMLQMGASRPWPDAMHVLTGTRRVSAHALLEYFRPLLAWLREDNARHGEKAGWPHATLQWGGH